MISAGEGDKNSVAGHMAQGEAQHSSGESDNPGVV